MSQLICSVGSHISFGLTGFCDGRCSFMPSHYITLSDYVLSQIVTKQWRAEVWRFLSL